MTENLWAPWRMEYILSKKSEECVFCIGENPDGDKERLVLYRSRFCFVILNHYPYNNGHLMVAPLRHVASLQDLDEAASHDLFYLLQKCVAILTQTLHAEGFNLGANLGKVAGAGVDQHLHIHLVPRWAGDTNFMPVVADVRVMPECLEDTYRMLRPHFLSLLNP
jgi:ATP adenylyltransferase